MKQLACGKDLKSPIKKDGLDTKEINNYRFGLSLLRKLYHEIYEAGISNKKIYLYDKIGCSLEKLHLLLTSPLIGKKSKYYQALQLGFGPTLEEYKGAFYEGIYRLKSIYQRVFITKTLQLNGESNLKNVTYLTEAVGCSYQELMNLINHHLFAKDTKYFLTLQKACGLLFDQKINLDCLTYREKRDFYYGIERLCQLYASMHHQKSVINVYAKKNGPYLTDILGCSYPELMAIVTKKEFNQDTLYYQALQKACGPNLDGEINLSKLTNLEISNYHTGVKRLKDIAKSPKKRKINLADYLSCDYADLEKVMPPFAYEFAPYYEFLVNLTATDFKQSFVYQDLSKSEKQHLRSIKNILRHRIANLTKKMQDPMLEGLHLNEIVGCSYDELLQTISKWDKDSSNYQLLATIFGANFDKHYTNQGLSIKNTSYVNQAIMALIKDFIFQSTIGDDIELLLPTTDDVKESFIVNLIVYLPFKYQKLIMAYFKGQMAQIATEYHMSLDRVYACSQIILEWFTKMNTLYNEKENLDTKIDFNKVQQYLLRTKN